MLKTQNLVSGQIYPEAKICIGKNRLKIYQDKYIYLNNGDEFTIELYNPTQSSILAKISLNDKIISNSGLVIRSGERIHLDRFLDEAKKFMFDTYEVSNTKTNQKAIEKNGLVKIEFFNEYIPTYTYYENNNFLLGGYGTTGNPVITPTWTTSGNHSFIGGGKLTTTNGTSGYSFIGNGRNNTSTSCYATILNSNNISYTNTSAIGDTLSSVNNSKSIETGMIEKGSNSNQKFSQSNKSFCVLSFKSIEYQILPKSQKPVESQELRNYCFNCGSKAKKEHRFCSACGTKL